MRVVVFTAVMATALSGGSAWAQSQAPVQGMVTLKLDGQEIEGMPLAFSAEKVELLGRDGRLWSFDPREATDYRQSAPRFQPYSISELRAILLRELGAGFEVTGTTHYLVAHPAGQEDRWAQRFEDLYRAFVHYFSVRGFKLSDPPFPLVGIVCHNRAEFNRYSSEQGGPVSQGVLGYYSLKSNRIALYDVGGGKANAQDWRENASTVIHEATHQTAFNTGIHNRLSPPPLWVAEGLATLFEAPGVNDSRSHTRRVDRINEDRFRAYQLVAAQTASARLPEALTASDEVFRRNPGAAYAAAWAMTFYLIETQPRPFARYLGLTAGHPPLAEYTSAERVADFESVFGDNWRLFDAKLRRFMAELR